MQFLYTRLTDTNTQTINRLDLGDFAPLSRYAPEQLHAPNLASAPQESLDSVVEALLDNTNTNPDIQRRITERPDLPNVMPALPTMYTADNRIDFPAQDKLMRDLVAQGIRGFVVMGTTGESSLVSFEEHEAAVERGIQTARQLSQEIGEPICIVAGAGANATAEQKRLAREAIDMGADATLLLPPYYVREQSDANMIRHFWRALDEGSGIIYRVTSRTGREISENIIRHLAQHPNFVGVKECDGRVRHLRELFDETQEGHLVWSGEDGEVDRDSSEGAFGSISVTANVHPNLILSANDNPSNGNSGHDNRIRQAAEYLADVTFKFGNPSTVHAIAEMVRQANGEEHIRGFRMPARALITAQREWTMQALSRVGVTNVADFDDRLIRNFDRSY